MKVQLWSVPLLALLQAGAGLNDHVKGYESNVHMAIWRPEKETDSNESVTDNDDVTDISETVRKTSFMNVVGGTTIGAEAPKTDDHAVTSRAELDEKTSMRNPVFADRLRMPVITGAKKSGKTCKQNITTTVIRVKQVPIVTNRKPDKCHTSTGPAKNPIQSGLGNNARHNVKMYKSKCISNGKDWNIKPKYTRITEEDGKLTFCYGDWCYVLFLNE